MYCKKKLPLLGKLGKSKLGKFVFQAKKGSCIECQSVKVKVSNLKTHSPYVFLSL